MEDFLCLDQQITSEEKMLRDSVRRWVDDKATPLMMDAFEQGEFPVELISQMGELGLFGMKLPVQYGGSEASNVAYGLVCQELERADSGLRSFVSVQSSLCMFPIHEYGSNTQKEKYLPRMAKGECIGCFGLTEPNSGSDPASMKTNAKKVDGGWLLNGTKMWITNATIADIAIVWAKVEDEIRGFIVEKGDKGFSTNKIKHKMSMRVSDTGELVLQDCLIPEDRLLPGTECGMKAPLSCLTQARFGIAFGAIGAAQACFETTLAYSKDRKQFKKPIGSFQLVQKDLVDCFNEIQKTMAMNLQIARVADTGNLTPERISLAKMNAAREALEIARKCRNLLGANGISLEYPVMRHLLNLETVFTYEGTDNIHHLILGKYLTGISAF